MKFIGAHIFDYDATFRSNVNVTGNLDVDGTINIDAADIDGNLQLDGTLTVGVDDTGYDVKFYGDTSGRFMFWDASQNKLRASDNVQLTVGSSVDFQISHDGTNTLLQNNTGNLDIKNNQNDGDITLSSDDGSGGMTPYLTLDGSEVHTAVHKEMNFQDTVRATFGASNDLQVYHDGSNSYIQNETGILYIWQGLTDGDISFVCDDGSGSETPYITLDGGLGFTTLQKNLRANDDVRILVGSSQDAEFFHDGLNTSIRNITGDLQIRQAADDKDIIFKCDDGSGGETAYITLDGSAGYTTVQKDIRFEDDVKAQFGNSGDLRIDHDSSGYGYVQNLTGALYFSQYAADQRIYFQADDGSGGITTYFMVDGGFSTPYTVFPDNSTLAIGSGLDLRIMHNGSDTFIDQTGNGDLYIRQKNDDKDIVFQSDDGSGDVTTYFKLDGSATELVASKNLRFDQSPSYIFFNGNNTFVGELSNSGKLQLRGGGSNMAATVYIDSSGNMGLGTSAPSSKLDVRGTVQVGVDDTGYDVKFFGATSGRYMLWDESDDSLQLPDNTVIKIGTGLDLKLKHDGTDSYIDNTTGDLKIRNFADDKDIVFQSDDGSGGTTEYFRVDGGSERIRVSKNLRLSDSVSLQLGNVADLSLTHDGTNSEIVNNTGDLRIKNRADDKDIIFETDDGSGGTTAYITLDGGDTITKFNKNVLFGDNTYIYIGAGFDFHFSHNGSDSLMQNAAGDLYIRNGADDKDIIFQSDDGSGGVETYFFLDGSTGLTQFPDDKSLTFGTGNDLRIFHGSNASVIDNYNYNLTIRNRADDGDISFVSDDGSGGLAEYFRVDGGITKTLFSKDALFTDSAKANFGSNSQLTIKHDGSNAEIKTVAGDLAIRNAADQGDITFQADNGSTGTTTYFQLDGSAADGTFVYSKFLDNSVLGFGTGGNGRLQIFHYNSDSTIQNTVGDLIIKNTADDKDILFQSDDGSGGVETYLFLDGSGSRTIVPDNKILGIGTSTDMYFSHNGTHSEIVAQNGNLTIKNTADDKDIIFQSDDGSGGVTTYFYLDGSAGGSDPATVFPDNSYLHFGGGFDLNIGHNGSTSYITNNTGDLYIRSTADDSDIQFQCDDGSGGVATYITLDGSHTRTKFDKKILIADSEYVGVGDGADLQIMHNGTNTLVDNITGDLYFRNYADDKDIIFQSDDGSGGVATYMTIDGGDGDIKVHKNFEIEKTLTLGHTADPSDPATGHSVVWSDTSGNLKVKINVAGTVVTRTLAAYED